MAGRNRMVAWHGFYTTARWQRLRKFQLMQHPLCKYCLANGRVEPATVVDHVKPHRGDWMAFCTGELQSLCDPCHKSTKAQIEKRGYCDDVGLDGLPIDPNHPFNRASRHS
jgi:hypothetical protein